MRSGVETLKFLFVTDLHGWADGYMQVLQKALDYEVRVIVNGGDMLPKGSAEVPEQRTFLEEFLDSYLELLAGYGIEFYGMFGNDDMLAAEGDWQRLITAHSNAHDMTGSWLDIGAGVIVRGCSYVPDHPFGLKDWSVLDTRAFVRPAQLTRPVLSKGSGFVPIDDVDSFFMGRPTLEDILERIGREAWSLDRAVLVSHAPPAGTGLANVDRETDVGSVAVRHWIEACQPLLTLHGHIHESPLITGVETAMIGRTTVHQPGQTAGGEAVFSLVSIRESEVRVTHSSTGGRH